MMRYRTVKSLVIQIVVVLGVLLTLLLGGGAPSDLIDRGLPTPTPVHTGR